MTDSDRRFRPVASLAESADELDRQVVPLLNALHGAGVMTQSSCAGSGRGGRPARESYVAVDPNSRGVAALIVAARKGGWPSWRVVCTARWARLDLDDPLDDAGVAAAAEGVRNEETLAAESVDSLSAVHQIRLAIERCRSLAWLNDIESATQITRHGSADGERTSVQVALLGTSATTVPALRVEFHSIGPPGQRSSGTLDAPTVDALQSIAKSLADSGDFPAPERPEDSMVKVLLPDEHGELFESLWATDLGGDRYRLENVPYGSIGLHNLDVVRAVRRKAFEVPRFAELVTPSGHRTMKLAFRHEGDRAAREGVLRRIVDLGCTFERATESLYAIDVPPEVDRRALRLAVDRAADLLDLEASALDAD
jgi:hypothetical protein